MPTAKIGLDAKPGHEIWRPYRKTSWQNANTNSSRAARFFRLYDLTAREFRFIVSFFVIFPGVTLFGSRGCLRPTSKLKEVGRSCKKPIQSATAPSDRGSARHKFVSGVLAAADQAPTLTTGSLPTKPRRQVSGIGRCSFSRGFSKFAKAAK